MSRLGDSTFSLPPIFSDLDASLLLNMEQQHHAASHGAVAHQVAMP
jgi:hypothetical protein